MDLEFRTSIQLRKASERFGMGFLNIVGPQLFLIPHPMHMSQRVKHEELNDWVTRIKNHIVHNHVANVREPESIYIGVNPVKELCQGTS